MSEDFIKIATEEINEELSKIISILDTCQNDSDVTKNAENIERPLHKIKGLAPMMGKTQIGNVAAYFDGIMKKINDGNQYDGVYDALTEIFSAMSKAMTGSDNFLEKLQQDVSKKLSKQN